MAPRSLLAAPFRFNQSDGCDNGVLAGAVKVEDFVRVPVKKPAPYPNQGCGSINFSG
jgi:hypothetical protein